MSFIADLHVHSHLSRATSKECTLEGLHTWAQLKGVRLVGTGDFTHPAWFSELAEKLEESGPGLYRLRPELAGPMDVEAPRSCRGPVDFMITGEISSIYKRGDRVRKVHSLLLAPDLATAAKINARLGELGNITSDGRPIMGLDPRDLLEIVLEASPDAYLIPAHIWTPWFSMLGSKSGFDSMEECFGDLSRHILAAETGLSSDPAMNWRVSSLDDVCLVSNSDLHSPVNMGRNANVFHCEVDFFAIKEALRSKDPAQCGGTIDLFPEEGKYHYDGHRKCGVCLEPEESLALDCRCPVCGKGLVLGVLHRVMELADRPKGGKPATALPGAYIIPLPEILAEIYDCGAKTKKVMRAYHRLLETFGPEMAILRELDTERLRDARPALLGEAIRRLRRQEVVKQPGYDGEYGVIRVFAEGEKDRLRSQGLLLSVPSGEKVERTRGESGKSERRLARAAGAAAFPEAAPKAPRQLSLLSRGDSILEGLNIEQREAAVTVDAPVIIVAGPGTGKTRTLTHRIAYLVSEEGVNPATVLAVTFTNRAATEMRERLRDLLGQGAEKVTVATFHAFCLHVLRRHGVRLGLPDDFALADQRDEEALLRAKAGMSAREAARVVEAISNARRDLEDAAGMPGFRELESTLAEERLVSLDAIIPHCVRLLREHRDIREQLGYRWMCVDEYQDINRAQYELVRLLALGGEGLCVIGDPDQAIYGFRGSDSSYFLRFTHDFPNARVFGLNQNFRSSDKIVAAAGQVITPSKSSMSVGSEGGLEAGVRVRLHEAATAAAEAEFITHEVEKWLGGTGFFSVDSGRVAPEAEAHDVSLGDIAVLVRLKALMKPLAEALSRLGLPIQVVGDRRFADEAAVREVIEGLRNGPRAALEMPASQAVSISAKPGAVDSEVFERCRRLAENFSGTLRAFLDHLLLRQDPDNYDGRAERIAIMTLHAAKGLEFPIVFVAACEAGILPYARPGEEPDLDEERRLLYVGMTRAKKVLYITSARARTLFGKSGKRLPSPFIREIEEKLMENLTAKRRKRGPSSTQLEFGFSA